MPGQTDPVTRWVEALEARHLADRTFAEVRRSVQALSSLYVERRGRAASGAALDGAGKRAAFALFYGPLHLLLVREIVRALPIAARVGGRIVDLGCGTGAAGAGWALAAGTRAVALEGVDRSGWAVEEARFTYRALGLAGTARPGDLARAPLDGRGVLAAFAVNELPDPARAALLTRLLSAAARGSAVLVVEPIARAGFAFWPTWEAAFLAASGRSDTWRLAVDLPPIVAKLDDAAGLDHGELTGRSLFVRGSGGAGGGRSR